MFKSFALGIRYGIIWWRKTTILPCYFPKFAFCFFYLTLTRRIKKEKYSNNVLYNNNYYLHMYFHTVIMRLMQICKLWEHFELYLYYYLHYSSFYQDHKLNWFYTCYKKWRNIKTAESVFWWSNNERLLLSLIFNEFSGKLNKPAPDIPNSQACQIKFNCRWWSFDILMLSLLFRLSSHEKHQYLYYIAQRFVKSSCRYNVVVALHSVVCTE